MKTKIVYIVTLRDGGLRFFEMFQLSVESLRLHQPDARIELIIDNVSYASLCETGQAVPKGVKLINVDVPQEWEKQKSRYLKTKLRTLTGGDYLYLYLDQTVSCEYTQDRHEQISALLYEITDAVRNSSFPANASKENCRYCPYKHICAEGSVIK